ncbi:MAG: hypothetical protein WAM60_03325 [Candidatus Promineifilaceae bacterium]
MENLIVVAIVIIVLWLGAMGFYLFVSRQQGGLADEIEQLREQLDKTEGEN